MTIRRGRTFFDNIATTPGLEYWGIAILGYWGAGVLGCWGSPLLASGFLRMVSYGNQTTDTHSSPLLGGGYLRIVSYEADGDRRGVEAFLRSGPTARRAVLRRMRALDTGQVRTCLLPWLQGEGWDKTHVRVIRGKVQRRLSHRR